MIVENAENNRATSMKDKRTARLRDAPGHPWRGQAPREARGPQGSAQERPGEPQERLRSARERPEAPQEPQKRTRDDSGGGGRGVPYHWGGGLVATRNPGSYIFVFSLYSFICSIYQVFMT